MVEAEAAPDYTRDSECDKRQESAEVLCAGTPAIVVAGNSPLPVVALVVDKVEKRWVETAVPLMSIQGGRPLHVRGA